MPEKYIPKVGEPLYLRQFTGNHLIDMIKRPYTVIEISDTEIKVQACELIYPIFHYDPSKMSPYYAQFDGKRVNFYDSMPEEIRPSSSGIVKTLSWHPHRQLWGSKGVSDKDFPNYAVFGKYEYFPYLD